MIEVEHRVSIKAQCPVDLSTDDYYNTLITVNRVLAVEDIHGAIARFTRRPIYQEDLTRALGAHLVAEVVTHGIHSGVYTTCRYDGRNL